MPVRKHSLPGNICWLQKWCDWFIILCVWYSSIRQSRGTHWDINTDERTSHAKHVYHFTIFKIYNIWSLDAF